MINKKAGLGFGDKITLIIFVIVIAFLILLVKNEGSIDLVINDIIFWR